MMSRHITSYHTSHHVPPYVTARPQYPSPTPCNELLGCCMTTHPTSHGDAASVSHGRGCKFGCMPCHAMPLHAMPYHVIPCRVMLCFWWKGMLSSTAFQRGRLKQPRRLSTTGGFLTGKLRCTSSIYLAFARYFDVTWLSSEASSLFFLLQIFWSLRLHPFFGGGVGGVSTHKNNFLLTSCIQGADWKQAWLVFPRLYASVFACVRAYLVCMVILLTYTSVCLLSSLLVIILLSAVSYSKLMESWW